MRCKAGDLAVIVRTFRRPELLGRIVMVSKPYEGPYEWGEPAWWLNGEEWHGPDSCLRPIRDPGDDASDETLDWLPNMEVA